MRRGANTIDEERVCIDSLVHYLKGIEGSPSINAQEEPHDPPDYWLTVGEHRFAAEVTSIVTDQGYVGLCHSLHDSIKKGYESGSHAAGMYVVNFLRRPDIPSPGSKKWRKLVADAMAKIKALGASPPGSKESLLDDESGDLTIWKLSDEGSTVELVRTPAGRWEGEVQGELAQLLQQSIEKKHRTIQNKGVMKECPDVILLLYDAYGYGDIAAAAKALSEVSGYDWLHSIFWAASFAGRTNILYPESPGGSGGFLYSKSDKWLQ